MIRRRTTIALIAVVALAGLGVGALVLRSEEREEAASHPVVARLAAPTAPRATVWAVGDGATGNRGAHQLAARIGRDADRVLYLGDVYPEGDPASYEKHFETIYGQIGRRTAPTIGNHEWEDRDLGYFPYWKDVFGASIPPYYAFRIAGWQIISLNSEAPHGPGSAQLAWLEKQLSRTGTCRIAYWHRPAVSAGTRGNYPDVQPLRRALVDKAAIVIYGHEHNSQRMRRTDGMTEFITGSGGASAHAFNPRDPRLAFGVKDVSAATRFVLQPGRASFALTTRDGRVLDRGEIPCRA